MVLRVAATLQIAALLMFMGCGGGSGGGGDGNGDGIDGGGPLDSAPDAGPATVTLSVGDSALPVEAALVAYQDGDGSWQILAAADGTYQFVSELGHYAIAVVCVPDAGGPRVHVFRALASDTSTLFYNCPSSSREADFDGTVSGLEGEEYAALSFGSEGDWVGNGPYHFLTAPGTGDALAVRNRGLGAVIVRRGITVEVNDSVFDFDMASAVPMEFPSASVVDYQDQEDLVLGSVFQTERGTADDLMRGEMGPLPPWFGSWNAAPTSLLSPRDIHHVIVAAGASPRRLLRAFVHEAGDVTLALPGPTDEPAVTAAAVSPYVRLASDLPSAAGISAYELSFDDGNPADPFWSVLATKGWITAAGVDALETPDLSGLGGWDAAWGIETGNTVTWTMTAMTSNRGAGGLLDAHAAARGVPPPAGLDGVQIGSSIHSGEIEILP